MRDLVSADGPGFARGIGLWFALAIPSTYTNSMVGDVVEESLERDLLKVLFFYSFATSNRSYHYV